jgi:hypothetical protein
VSLEFKNFIKVRKVETRSYDTWYDMSLRQLRTGEVIFFVVKDFLTGKWMFKLCNDKENGKIIVKAIKCPPGTRFSQLEGRSMVFQDSLTHGFVYGVISLTEMVNNNRLRRNVVSCIEEVPLVIRQNYEVKSYEAATGKKAPGKHLVTLSERENKKELVKLFVIERAWGLSKTSPKMKLKEKEQMLQKKIVSKKEVDTGKVLLCPICNKKHRLIHVETEKTIKHVLRKLRLQ